MKSLELIEKYTIAQNMSKTGKTIGNVDRKP